MQIHKDDSIRSLCLDEMRKSFGTNTREGIHLTDLLYPRQAYWKKVKPKPLTDDEILYFIMGRSHEDAFHRLSGYEHGKTEVWKGIHYSPDLMFNFPGESKTRRGYMAKEGEEAERYEHYIKQLKGYCAIANKTQGWLLIWTVADKADDYSTKPGFGTYRVEFTEDELENERRRLIVTRDILKKALEGELSYNFFSLCPQWMCGKLIKTMTKKPRCIECNKEFSTESGAIKHPKTKAGKGHTIEDGEYDVSYKKRCKWFDECNPFKKEERNGMV